MAKSDYIFEEGDAIDVGSHGDNDVAFASGEPIPDTGDSAFVFEAGVGLGPAGLIEDWERTDPLADYGGDTGDAVVDTSSPVVSGDKSMKFTGTDIQSISTTSLDRLPQEGETVRCYIETNVDSDVEFGWYSQSGNVNPDGYFWQIHFVDNKISLYRRVNGVRTEKEITSFGFDNYKGQTLYVDTELGSSSSFTSTAYTEGGTQLASVSYDDPDDLYSSGGIEFDWNNFTSSGYCMFDAVQIV